MRRHVPCFRAVNRFCAGTTSVFGEREKVLRTLFLASGAESLEKGITCEHFENILQESIAHDSTISKQTIRTIISDADLDNEKSICWNEFVEWFQPLKEDQLTLKALVEYWSSKSELKSPKIIFNNIWSQLTTKYGEKNLTFPSQLFCLGGAPGAGKGTNTPFILKERGIESLPIVMSSLLESPAMQKIKASGGLVGDSEVLLLFLEELLQPPYQQGVVVDGFPRTRIQVEFLRLLADKMLEQQKKFAGTALAHAFTRPAFRMIVLYINETESVKRQLARGSEALQHNQSVTESGEGSLLEIRETDVSAMAARKRYKVFTDQALDALQSLKQEFPYHVIDASGTIKDVEKEIKRELAYQSSMELSSDTYEAIRGIPTSKDITLSARQHMVMRLDGYQKESPERFAQVIQLINSDFIPVLRRHALSGACCVVLPVSHPYHDSVGIEETSMIIDILADRNYNVNAVEHKGNGIRFDLQFHTTHLHKE